MRDWMCESVMNAHRIETSVDEHGAVHVTDLPFEPGDPVEVIVLERTPRAHPDRVETPAQIIDLFGTIDFDPEYDYKAARGRDLKRLSPDDGCR